MAHIEANKAALSTSEKNELTNSLDAAVNSGKLGALTSKRLSKVYVVDVEKMALSFFDQTELFENANIPCPAAAMRGGVMAPIDVYGSIVRKDEMPEDGTLRSVKTSMLQQVANEAKKNATDAGFQVTEISLSSARKYFKEGFRKFMTCRAEAFLKLSTEGSRAKYGATPAPNLNIVVNTRGTNLQVLYSPAFFVSIQTVFGNNLSSPVTGTISPGLYVFGAKGSQLPITFEQVPYTIPPTSTINMISV